MDKKDKGSQSTGYKYQRPAREWNRLNARQIMQDYRKYLEEEQSIQNNVKKAITASTESNKGVVGYNGEDDVLYLAVYRHHKENPVLEFILGQPVIWPACHFPRLEKDLKVLEGVLINNVGFKYKYGISDLSRNLRAYGGLPTKLIWKMEGDLPEEVVSLDADALLAEIRDRRNVGFLYPRNPK